MLFGSNWATNVVRFPVETRARPPIGLLRDIAPDCREIGYMAEATGLPLPDWDLRHRIDQATNEMITLMQLPCEPAARRTALAKLRDKAVETAIRACGQAEDHMDAAYHAQERFLQATNEGDRHAPALQARADRMLAHANQQRLDAHALCDEAEGISRAVSIALRGEAWKPFDPRAEEAALFGLAPGLA
jgi:hypothetical protein